MWLPKQVVWKQVRLHLDPLLKAHGFQRSANRKYWRIRDGMLQLVLLLRSDSYIKVDIAIQPLFVPVTYIVLAFGERLGFLAHGRDYMIDLETEPEMLQGLQRAVNDLQRAGLPFLDHLATVRELATFYADGWIKDGKIMAGLSGGMFWVWLGFCYAYLGEYDLAIRLIEENYLKTGPTGAVYTSSIVFLDVLKNSPDDVPALLEKWAAETLEHLKLR